jgi:ubiquinone/menaquinone biosynthesis C-methylase UbiE
MHPMARFRRASNAILGCIPGLEYRPFPDSNGRDTTHEDRDVPALLAFAAPAPGLRILEIGCGGGVALPVIAARCRPARLVAIDIDRGLLARATERVRARGVAADLVRADVRAMPFPEASFDLVIDFGTCFHIARGADALREIHRVLRPGGLVAYESKRNQLVSHPFRSALRTLDWSAAPGLRPLRATRDWGLHTRL